MEGDHIYYVYKHVEDFREVVYIGMGTAGRAYASTGRKGRHKEWMESRLNEGSTTFVEFEAVLLSREEALEEEEYLIKKYQPRFNRFFTDLWKEMNKERGLKGAKATMRPCITPLGSFESVSAAARAEGFKDPGSILHRIKSKRDGYEYKEI